MMGDAFPRDLGLPLPPNASISDEPPAAESESLLTTTSTSQQRRSKRLRSHASLDYSYSVLDTLLPTPLPAKSEPEPEPEAKRTTSEPSAEQSLRSDRATRPKTTSPVIILPGIGYVAILVFAVRQRRPSQLLILYISFAGSTV